MVHQCHNCNNSIAGQYYKLDTSPMTLYKGTGRICQAIYTCKILCDVCVKNNVHKQIYIDTGSTVTPILKMI